MKFFKKSKRDLKPEESEKGFIDRWTEKWFRKKNKTNEENETSKEYETKEAPPIDGQTTVRRKLKRVNSYSDIESTERSVTKSRPQSGTWSDYLDVKNMITNENSNESDDELETYDIDGDRDLLMINISKYDSSQERIGSDKDIKSLKAAFMRRKFQLFREALDGEVKKCDVQDLIDSYIQSHRKPKLFAIVVMAHGGEHDRVQFTNGYMLSINKLLEPLFNSEKLYNVPKIIVCQFCRGVSLITTSFQLDSADKTQSHSNTQADTMFFFATAEGNPAVRHPETGSPFVNEFCRVFCSENNAFNMSLKINKKLKKQEFQVFHESGESGKHRQVSSVRQTLEKQLIFENCDVKTDGRVQKAKF